MSAEDFDLAVAAMRSIAFIEEQSSELYPNEGGGMASLTHSRKVYERLGPWLFARGPILNERITHGVWRRFSFKMLSLSHCARSTFKRLPAASRQPSFPIVRLPSARPASVLPSFPSVPFRSIRLQPHFAPSGQIRPLAAGTHGQVTRRFDPAG